MAPQSIERTSPSLMATSLGIPCTTSSLGEISNVLGQSYNPLKPGIAPLSRMYCSASVSSLSVVTPGLISAAIIPKVLLTINAARRMISNSSLFFVTIIIYGK